MTRSDATSRGPEHFVTLCTSRGTMAPRPRPAGPAQEGHVWPTERGNGGSPRPRSRACPIYYRALLETAEAGVGTISSERLATLAGVNAAKVRKDLSYLGSYGTRGVGYEVDHLVHEISRELGLTQDWPVVIVGIGNLGHALANYRGFGARGFRVVALVDADPGKVERKVAGPPGRRRSTRSPTSSTSATITIGIIATPASAAQEVADRLVEAGIRSILNFAPAVVVGPRRGVAAQGRPRDRAADPELLPVSAAPTGSARRDTAGGPGMTTGAAGEAVSDEDRCPYATIRTRSVTPRAVGRGIPGEPRRAPAGAASSWARAGSRPARSRRCPPPAPGSTSSRPSVGDEVRAWADAGTVTRRRSGRSRPPTSTTPGWPRPRPGSRRSIGPSSRPARPGGSG